MVAAVATEEPQIAPKAAQVSTAAVIDLAKDMLGAGLQLARGLADWQTCAAGLERSARDLRLAAPGPAAGARIRWTDPVPDGVDPESVRVELAAQSAPVDRIPGVDLRLHIAGQRALGELDEPGAGCRGGGHQPANLRAVRADIG